MNDEAIDVVRTWTSHHIKVYSNVSTLVIFHIFFWICHILSHVLHSHSGIRGLSSLNFTAFFARESKEKKFRGQFILGWCCHNLLSLWWFHMTLSNEFLCTQYKRQGWNVRNVHTRALRFSRCKRTLLTKQQQNICKRSVWHCEMSHTILLSFLLLCNI